MNRPRKRRKHRMRIARTTSREDLLPIVQRECWYQKTLVTAFNSDNPHRELMVIRPTNSGHSMNGYEYTLCTSIQYSKRAGDVAKDAGCQLSDVVQFDRLKCVNKKCLTVFL